MISLDLFRRESGAAAPNAETVLALSSDIPDRVLRNLRGPKSTKKRDPCSQRFCGLQGASKFRAVHDGISNK